jgi:hypothetical protein
LRRFADTFALPSTVRGPVEHPPCHLQRRLPGTLRASQGWPSRRRLALQATRSSFDKVIRVRAFARDVMRNGGFGMVHPNSSARVRDAGGVSRVRHGQKSEFLI